MTNGYPSQWPDALRIDDDAWSQGSDDPSYYYGGSVYVLADEFTESPIDGSMYTGGGVRPAFFTIRRSALTHLRMTFGTFGGGADIVANLYFRPPGEQHSWYTIGLRETPQATAVFDLNLDPEVDYYFVVVFKDEATAQFDASYTWYAEVDQPTAPADVSVPPIAVEVAVAGLSDDAEPPPGTVSVPPIAVLATVASPDLWSGTITLSAPEASAVVASTRPRFMVAVNPSADADYDYTIEVQYADDEALSNAVTLSARASVADGGAVLSPAADLSGTVYWRARIRPDGQLPAPWTAARSFTVDITVSATTVAVTWTVSASAARPIHLWHVFPPGPDVGDTVTVYGQGFPATGTVYFGGQDLTLSGWKRVGAVSGGVIEGPTVNPEHYEITFVAPSYDGEGELLSVTADTGEIGI